MENNQLHNSRANSTVWLNMIAHFAVVVLLLHQYRSNLASLSDIDVLVIGLSKSEKRAKKN